MAWIGRGVRSFAYALFASLVALSLSLPARAETAPPATAPSGEEAEAALRAYFLPHDPVGFVAASFGAGAIGNALSVDKKGKLVGHGGVFTVDGRFDLERTAPLWLSAEARLWVGTPLEYKVDASFGYEFRLFHQGGSEKDRFQIRPLLGVTVVQFANSPLAATVGQSGLARTGLDWVLLGDGHKQRAWRAHVVALWDFSAEAAGFDAETTWNVTVPRRLAGFFIGAGGGFIPSAGGVFHFDFGGTFELGR
jgi:hypothetical protein